ncbi:MAG: CRISPR-associated endonuclease Cas1 [Bacillota bacterium]|nr:CRISPR-associated endonuclease Cas1 [Bacillota bacterium]
MTYHYFALTKNPPENEVNAMMSYGYALLYGILLSILDRSSLFPQISFIHSLSKNCDSLQYDLADIFKPVLVDRLIFRMIRKKQIKEE